MMDWKRHFSELRQQVLPIFLAIVAVAILLVALLAPEGKGDKEEALDDELRRVSLLSTEAGADFDPAFILTRPIELARAPRAVRVDFPMGSASGAFSYNAQPFLENRHLGDDLNGIGGWDSDLGDAVYAVADGEVVFVGWPSDGWGRVMMIQHRDKNGRMLQSFYAHLDRMDLPLGARVLRGAKIGTVGKGNGQYLAHLHFEVREGVAISAGPGYGDHSYGRLSGESWLTSSRGAPDDRLNAAVSGYVPDSSELPIGVTMDASSK